MSIITIIVKGGIVSDVYSNDLYGNPDIQVIDLDNYTNVGDLEAREIE